MVRFGLMDITSKPCRKCGEVKPLDQYHVRKKANGKQSIASTCKHCEHAARTEYGRTDKGKQSRKEVYDRMMSDPDKKAKLLEFWKSEKGKEIRKRYEATDKAKARTEAFIQTEKGEKYLKAKWERHRKHRADWIEEAGDTLKAWEWKRILRSYGGACAYCGSKEDITMDHIIPVSKGGPNVRTNVCPACDSCNRRKKDAMDWKPNPPQIPLPW